MNSPTSPLPRSRFLCRAFSLTEVVLALGIASFCLVSLVGLLPVGLGVVKSAREQAAGATCLSQLSEGIRTAVLQTDGSHQVGGKYSNITWKDAVVSFSMDDVSLGGTRTTTALNKRLAVHVTIEPPSLTSVTGRALVSVAWPSRATWNAAASTWSNAQGSVSSWLILLPTP